MSRATTIDDEVGRYADAVLAELSDLPVDERADLVEDLGHHLAEVAAEGEGTLVAQLGEPAAYAAELRASAGLGAQPSRRSWGQQLRTARADAAARARSLPGVGPVLDFLPSLRPAWWVARGPLLVGAFAVLAYGPLAPVPTFLAAVAAAVASVAVARARPRRGLRGAVVVANVVAGWVGLWFALSLFNSGLPSASAVPYEPLYEPAPASDFLTHPGGEPITNLYVYDSQGRPLEDVYVFDGGGRPVEVGPPDRSVIPELETDYDRAPDGTPLTNRYPLDQYLRSFEAPDGSFGRPLRRPRPAPEVQIPGLDARARGQEAETTDAPRTEDASAPDEAGGTPPPSEVPSGSR